MIVWRPAVHADISEVVALLVDDPLGSGREATDLALYLSAFEAMQIETDNHLIVGERRGEVIATYQITFIWGLSRKATRRAQVEAVRVAAALRGQGIGATLFADAERRAVAAGCGLLQLTSDNSRERAHGFYLGMGFVASHTGFKKGLG